MIQSLINDIKYSWNDNGPFATLFYILCYLSICASWSIALYTTLN